ncbi:MAG: hypothetical protein DHS20C14_16120 [Phycisphaeraceae bacterium]|nr:MAG: hypothetical protein DHS20C14_16120 [Phycisphaeraceae bacterium]
MLICTQTGGGDSISPIARPSVRVDSTRERRISSQWSGVLMQSTVRPARVHDGSRTDQLARPLADTPPVPPGVPPRALSGSRPGNHHHLAPCFGEGMREREPEEPGPADDHDARLGL